MAPFDRNNRPAIAGPETPKPPYPIYTDTTIIAGFGRGSSDLGIPTANIPPTAYDPILDATAGIEESETGIYFGYAAVYPGSKEELDRVQKENTEYLESKGLKPVSEEDNGTVANPKNRDIEFTYGSTLEKGVDSCVVFPMVMSVGWNPFYNNKTRSAEIYIIHDFKKHASNGPKFAQFYGARIKIITLGYIRPELDYVSVEGLIKDINIDVEVALKSLERPAYAKFAKDSFFSVDENN